MYGKWIIVNLGDDYHVSVYVGGTPTDSADEFRARALRKLILRLEREAESVGAAR